MSKSKAPTYTFDDSLQIGDLVVNSFNNTICRLVRIEPQEIKDAYTAKRNDAAIGDLTDPHVTLIRLCSSEFRIIKGKKEEIYNGGYIRRLDKNYFDTRIREYQDKIHKIEEARKVFS